MGIIGTLLSELSQREGGGRSPSEMSKGTTRNDGKGKPRMKSIADQGGRIALKGKGFLKAGPNKLKSRETGEKREHES